MNLFRIIKRKTDLKLLLTTMIVLCSVSVFSQNHTVTGVIKDAATNETLIGVSVKVQGKQIGTTTDIDGRYTISVDPNAVLEITYLGYTKTQVSLGGKTIVNVAMKQDAIALNEVVAIGYGTQRKKELTGAVSQIKSEDMSKIAASDFTKTLQGQVAGVSVSESSGRPGDNANIQIRGIGSINANASPIYVVDGIIYESNPNIASEDIATVDILKDGASCAIYGTRGANGVILITTKRGKAGESKVSFSSYYGIQNITSGTALMNTQQQIYANEMYSQSLGGHSATLFYNPNAMDYNSDFVGAITNNNAPIQNDNLTISGGKDNLTFSVNTNYFKQDGILILSGYNRFSTRANVGFKKGKFDAFVSVNISKTNKDQEPYALYQYAQYQAPFLPPLDITNSSITVKQGQNADQVGYLARILNVTDNRNENSYNVTANLKYHITNHLVYHVNLGYNNYDYFRKQFQPQFFTYDKTGTLNILGSRLLAQLEQDNNNSTKTTIENVLSYDNTFGLHKIGIVAGYTLEEGTSRASTAVENNFISNSVQEFNGGSTLVSMTGSSTEHNVIGKLVRLQYSYNDKYLLSASGRYDASSRMGYTNKYGFFPGVSAGWNINQESFLKHVDQIQNLKLRASYGELGNEGIGDYLYSPYVIPNVDYVWGPESSDQLGLGAIQRGYANSDIKWETSISRDLGLDLTMFNGKFTFTADYYQNSKKNMLLNVTLPASTGTNTLYSNYNSIVANVGNMTNNGIELAATYRGRTNFGLNYSLTGTYTTNQNEITSMGTVGTLALSSSKLQAWTGNDDVLTYMKVGYPAGSFFLVQAAGVIQNATQLALAKIAQPTAKLGDEMYVDQDKNGVINENDRVYMGSGQSKGEAGMAINLDYKGFDFSIQMFSSYGSKVYNGGKEFAYATNRSADMYNMWTPQNSTSNIPTPSYDNTRQRSSLFLENGDYLRIQNLSLGYTLPKSWISSIFDKARIYFSAQNAFTFTRYQGYDPEVGGNGVSTRGVDAGNYPITRKFLTGIQIDF